jgi:1-acyl-sn-glycerol-3-phosphate acyltransferase
MEPVMKRLPLSDELAYKFIPPRHSPLWFWLGGYYALLRNRREQKIVESDVQGLERLSTLLARGDSVLITPNHPDHADCFVLYEISRRLKRPFTYMAAYQIFTGAARWVLPRIGVFSVDREGADLSAFKTAVSLLAEGNFPLVIFPEGEIYRVAERVTPLREGAFAIAAAAARKLEGTGRKLWILPVGMCYRFVDGHDPLPALRSLMDRLETRFTWRVQDHRPLVERILHYADGILSLKEVEYLGSPASGTFKDRAANLMERILAGMEGRLLKGRRATTTPERVKELRRACLELLVKPECQKGSVLWQSARNDLEDLFVVMQIFSYPGDYVRLKPTVERLAETLMKCEEDFLGVDQAPPRAARRVVVRIGEPLDLSDRLAAAGQSKPRQLVPLLAVEIEARIQSLLDSMPPGRPADELATAKPAENTIAPRKDDVLAGKTG